MLFAIWLIHVDDSNIYCAFEVQSIKMLVFTQVHLLHKTITTSTITLALTKINIMINKNKINNKNDNNNDIWFMELCLPILQVSSKQVNLMSTIPDKSLEFITCSIGNIQKWTEYRDQLSLIFEVFGKNNIVILIPRHSFHMLVGF